MLFSSQYHDFVKRLPWVRLKRKKMALRELDGQKRRIMTAEQVHEESRKIVSIIEQMHTFRDAKTIMVYYPIHNEVDLRHLVHNHAEDKTFLLPATISKNAMEVRIWQPNTPLVKGRFGIPEPSTPAYTGDIDLILVPGVAFDKHCQRLGRGGGYYDRFLKKFKHAKKIGVCYSFQLHSSIPHGWLDQPMDRVVTPTQAIEA